MYAPPNSLMMATNSSLEQDGTIRTSWLGHDSSGFEPRLRRTQEENSELELGATGEQWWIYIGARGAGAPLLSCKPWIPHSPP